MISKRTRGSAVSRWAAPALGLTVLLLGACASEQRDKPAQQAGTQQGCPCGAQHGSGHGQDGGCCQGGGCGQDGGCCQGGCGQDGGCCQGGGCGMGMGHGPSGMGHGHGHGTGPGPGGGPMCSMGTGPLTDSVRDAVFRALEDERRAESAYNGVLAQFGSVLPFSHIEHAEQRHSGALERLLTAHGVAIPAQKPLPPAPKYESIAAACAAGVTSEKANIAMYDELSKSALPDDVKCVFDHLRSASQDRHLPVFQSCSGAK